MLEKIIGVLLLIVGGIIGLAMLAILLGVTLKILGFAIKVAIPVVLIYAGYRLLKRDRNAIVY